MIYNVYTNWNDPKTSITIYVIWTCLIIFLGIKFKLLLTTGLIPAGFLAFILNATLPKK